MKNWKSCLTAALALATTTVFSAEPLLLQWGTIDTSGTEAQAESAALKAKVAKKAALTRARKSAAAEERAAYVVQFPGPVTEEWRTWLEASTQVRGYLPEFAYLVWATTTEMETIAANPDVFWTGEWKKDYKTVRAGTTLAPRSATDTPPARWMHLSSLLAGDDGAADLRARLEALGVPVRSVFARLDGSAAVALLVDDQIDEVADWPDVEWLEPIAQAVPCNDKAVLANMMDVEAARAPLSSGGLGLTGAGQTVAVADTGLDIGSTTGIHPDFAGRVIGYAWTNGNYTSSASWKDIGGHGTHVCGSVLGSGAASSNLYRGVAYEANLVIQGCWTNLSGLPQTYFGPMLKQASSAGARIHSDSWGYGTNYAGAYFQSCPYIDAYMWTNQNFLMVIAAGNAGMDADADGVVDPGSVSAPGTAKNCLCVGAAENWRSSGGYAALTYGGKWSADYPANPIKSDTISQTNAPQGLAAFSGRGPTTDGRLKPDIVAPGTDIVSARSRATAGTGWGVNSANTNYLYMGGTSMATPLTSGAAALVRQWLVDRKGIDEPMAALMKALLINGARDMTPGQYGTNQYQEVTARPDRSQGFGHVDLYNSLEPSDGNFLVFVTNKFTAKGYNFTTNIAVGQPNAGKYILTLAWQDYPADLAADTTLVNDLDLTVTSPSGTVFYPNNLSTNDRLNNVEFIEFTASETGYYAVKVNAYNISKTNGLGCQPFALVMRGPETVLEETAPAFSSSTATASIVLGETLAFGFSSLLEAGYPVPTYYMFTSVSPYSFTPATGELSFTPASAGTYTFTCSAANDLGDDECTLTVTVTLPPPSTPANLALTDVGTTSFTASWSAAANAESYSLDVATVSGSATPSALVSEDFSGCTADSSYSNGSFEGDGGTWVYTNAIFAPGAAASSPGSAGRIQLKASTGYLHLPAVDTPSSFSINMAGSTTGTMTLDQYVSGTWTPIASWDISAACGTFTHTFTNAGAATELRIHGTKALYIYDIEVSGVSATYTSLTGYPKSVTGTNAAVTGLSPSTTYAARVCGVNADGASDWSAWATATTTAGDSAPSWTAFPAQTYRYGSGDGYFDFDVSPYVSGSPSPALRMADTDLNAVFLEETGEFTFEPDALGTFSFTFTASNTLGVATNVLTVTVDAIAPELAAIGDRSGTVGTDVEFPLSATGDPAPVFDVTSDDAEAVVVEQSGTSYFLFSPDATGTFHFTVTATNIAGADSESFTVTVSDTPVTVPTLTVTNVTDTTALASWTACDGVTEYTLQLSTNDFAAASSSAARDAATLLHETFADVSGTGSLNFGTGPDNAGWEGNYVFAHDGAVRISSKSNNGDIESPWLTNATAGATISVVFSSLSWTNDSTTAVVEITEDGETYTGATSFALGAAMTAYSNDFTVTGTRFRVRWTSSVAKKRFFLDDITIASASSGGDTPAGDGIQTFTVTGTSHTFTNLTPYTVHYARVKGNADWSNVEEFLTEETPSPGTDYEQWLADNGYPDEPGSTIATNGATYYDNYIADIDPTTTNQLEIVPDPSTGATFTITATSPNRYYQFIYSTNLAAPDAFATNNLGLGATNASSIAPFPADWYGSIRVLLDEP